ncbi:MAG: hypothetical protein IAG13_29530, partial [Deltaproteobacteria bacterium]|nr:hypothetical protein [Nannocystaceae bacterium]
PPPELALSGFGRVVVQVHTGVRGDPPPPPPPQPLRVTGYDGLAIGTTLLLWDTAGRSGVIVNPTHDALGEVLARARALRIVDASGKSVPIRWSAVLDTGAIADAVARDRKQPPLVRKDGAVQFDYGLVNMDALDVVDAASLGRELGVPAVTSHVGRPKGIGLRLVREPDDYTTIRVSWGPFELDDTNRPENSGYVTRL